MRSRQLHPNLELWVLRIASEPGMLTFGFAFLLMFGSPQQPEQEARFNAEQFRRQSIEVNVLAGQIRSEADARRVVDTIARTFERELPPMWTTETIRERIAHAEYAAVSDPARLIPEERVANVWNEYVREVGAPNETLVTTAEIHWVRDARFSSSQRAWARGYQSIWEAPNIYAVGADGKVAHGCRAVETLRLLWELDNLFETVRIARERIQQGILTSDLLKKQAENPNPPKAAKRRVETRAYVDAGMHAAERRYVQHHGEASYDLLLGKLFEELFPE